jgi:hypothetical protein
MYDGFVTGYAIGVLGRQAALGSAVVSPFYLGTVVKGINSLNIISPKR